MKRFITLFSIVFFAVLLYSQSIISDFKVYEQNGKVILEWTSDLEEGVRTYHIQRSMNGGVNYFDLNKVAPYGTGASYLYIDNTILGSKSDMVYTYRLKVSLVDESVQYSNPVNISMTVSSIQMTWGSIKAMFR